MSMQEPLHSANVDALETTIAALPNLTDAHEALVTACRSLAAAVDAAPGKAALWHEYRAALAELASIGEADDGDGDDLSRFLASVRTPVLHPPQS